MMTHGCFTKSIIDRKKCEGNLTRFYFKFQAFSINTEARHRILQEVESDTIKKKFLFKMNLIWCQFSLVLVWILNINLVQTEMFTALADMEQLLETEAVLITNLENYIELQEEKIDFFKR